MTEIKSEQFGIRLQPLMEDEGRMAVQILSKDDEQWFEVGEDFSSYWLADLVLALEQAKALLLAPPFGPEPDGYGFRFEGESTLPVEVKAEQFGVRFQPRGAKDPHVAVQLLSEDDEQWFEVGNYFSSFWLADLIQVSRQAQALLLAPPFVPDPEGFGYLVSRGL